MEDAEGFEELDFNERDGLISGLKGLIGAVPTLGPIVAELISAKIPGQRIDRVARVLKALEGKIKEQEINWEESKKRFSDVGFVSLLEKSLEKASKAVTEERIKHIASILEHGLLDVDSEYSTYEKILAIFSQLSDGEVIVLCGHAIANPRQPNWFAQSNDFVLRHIEVFWPGYGLAQQDVDELVQKQRKLYGIYLDELVDARLLSPNERGGAMRVFFDDATKESFFFSHHISTLGKMVTDTLDLPRTKR